MRRRRTGTDRRQGTPPRAPRRGASATAEQGPKPARADHSAAWTRQLRHAGWMRRVGELTEQPGDDERGLLAYVHSVVAHSLERTAHAEHHHRPLARVHVVTR